MDGLSDLEPDCSEFVEIDPTGRYGRVWFSLSLFLSLLLFLILRFVLVCSTMKFWEKGLQKQCRDSIFLPFYGLPISPFLDICIFF